MYRDYEEGDIIRIKNEEGEYVYLAVDIDDGEGVCAFAIEDDDDDYSDYYTKDKIEYIEPVYIDREKVRQFARFEISFEELSDNIYPPCNIACEPIYRMTLDDILSAINNAKNIDNSEFDRQWLYHIIRDSEKIIDICRCYYGKSGIDGYRFLPSEDSLVGQAISKLCDILLQGEGTLEEECEELKNYIRLESLHVQERDYPDEIKRSYIEHFEQDRFLDSANENELALLVQYTNELADKNDIEGLERKAYSCYGGNKAFACDWVASRDCLLKLIELKENAFYANTLGYIYYYGRCNNGEPEYEKAFKYFSIGAAAGIYESRYKISDMLRHGYGVPKNIEAATTIIKELYNENLKYIQKNFLRSKFADVALRLGNCFEKGEGFDINPNAAYYYYLQADFAIRMRMLESDGYGDAKVAAGIRESIDRVLPLTEYEKRKNTVHCCDASELLVHAVENNRRIEAKIKRLSNGQYRIKFRQIPKADEKYTRKMFITVPEAHYCGLVEHFTVTTTELYNIKVNGKVFNGDNATVVFDSAGNDIYSLYGEKVLEIRAAYKFTVKEENKNKKYRFASVEFSRDGKRYDYICDDDTVKEGDDVIVITDRGETTVNVVKIFEKTENETALPIGKYKKIQRKAD